MKHLQALLAGITAALVRGGSGAARREADHQIVRDTQQGARAATEKLAANTADFCHHYEEWHGVPPEPNTPREDPHDVAKARMGRIAELFLLALKVLFWTVFGPAYFNVLAWVAVVIAVCISVTLSLGIKPLLAGLILKPGLTPHQKEQRLHAHVVAGITAFAVTFGGLFFLRGLGGPLALIGAMLVLPTLSLCDLVLLYLMGVAHAFTHLYGWAAPFVRDHHTAAGYVAAFEQHQHAAQNRLGTGDASTASPSPEAPARTPVSATPALPPESQGRTNTTTIAAALVLLIGLLGASAAHAQATLPSGQGSHGVTTGTTTRLSQTGMPDPQGSIADLWWDSTTSVYPTVAETIAPVIAHTFAVWADQLGAHRIRVSTFERDGWLPRTITDTTMAPTPTECAAERTDGSIFRGMAEALDQQRRADCDRAKNHQYDRIQAKLAAAIAIASHAAPVVDPKHGRSCTAFRDALAGAGRAPAGHFIAIASDTEETCNIGANSVPDKGAGADVIIIMLPSNNDMGPGVSAASRFNAKKAYLEKIAPWLRVILAPTDVESYRLPIAPPTPTTTKISFWQR